MHVVVHRESLTDLATIRTGDISDEDMSRCSRYRGERFAPKCGLDRLSSVAGSSAINCAAGASQAVWKASELAVLVGAPAQRRRPG